MWDPLANLHITDTRDMQVSDNAQCELNYVLITRILERSICS